MSQLKCTWDVSPLDVSKVAPLLWGSHQNRTLLYFVCTMVCVFCIKARCLLRLPLRYCNKTELSHYFFCGGGRLESQTNNTCYGFIKDSLFMLISLIRVGQLLSDCEYNAVGILQELSLIWTTISYRKTDILHFRIWHLHCKLSKLNKCFILSVLSIETGYV